MGDSEEKKEEKVEEKSKEEEKEIETEKKEDERLNPFKMMETLMRRNKELADKELAKLAEKGEVVTGFSITVGPDGKGEFKSWGNQQPNKTPLKKLEKTKQTPDAFYRKDTFKIILSDCSPTNLVKEVTVKGKKIIIVFESGEQRELSLPDDVDPTKLTWKENNGILEITIKKIAEEPSFVITKT